MQMQQYTPAYYPTQPFVSNMQFANSGMANFLRPTATAGQNILPLSALPQAAQSVTRSGLPPQPFVGSNQLAPIRNMTNVLVQAKIQQQNVRRAASRAMQYTNTYSAAF